MGDELQDFFKAAVKVAKQAGERVKTDFYKTKTYDCKENFADLVTESDKAVEEMIISNLSKQFPSHVFIGEETVSAGNKCALTDDPTWIIDPIDGTTNFVHGIPETCISIGLAVDKQIVVGVIHCPIKDEMYTAVKGQGAYCNDKKLSVSTINELNKSAAIIEIGANRDPDMLQIKINNIKALIENCHGIRMYGSAAIDMCLVARGSHEAYVTYGIHVWDIAAGALIVQEAGGVALDPTGGPLDLLSRRALVACNQDIADQVSNILQHITMERD